MRRRIISVASAAALALGIGIGVASPAGAQYGDPGVELCQFADYDRVSDMNCVVGDVAADGVTVIVPDGPNYAEAPV